MAFGAVPNPRVQFLGDEDFNALYGTRLAELTEQLFANGTAGSVLAT